MLVRNNTNCPNCGSVTSGTMIWLADKARIFSKLVPVVAECNNCGLNRTVLFKFADLYETLLKGYFASKASIEFPVSDVWALLKRYRFRHQVVLLNRLAKSLNLAPNLVASHRPLDFENIFFSSLADEIWRCSSGVNPSFLADSSSLRGMRI